MTETKVSLHQGKSYNSAEHNGRGYKKYSEEQVLENNYYDLTKYNLNDLNHEKLDEINNNLHTSGKNFKETEEQKIKELLEPYYNSVMEGYRKKGNYKKIIPMEKWLENQKPEEIIIQAGNKDNPGRPDDVEMVSLEVVSKLQSMKNVVVLNLSVHHDETTPHGQVRFLMLGENEKGLHINKKSCCLENGFERPDLNSPEGKYNNPLISFTSDLRDFTESCFEKRGLKVNKERSKRKHLSVGDYKDLKKQEAQLVERENEITKREQAAIGHEKFNRDRSLKIRERESNVLQKEEELKKKEEYINKKDEFLIGKNDYLNKKEEQSLKTINEYVKQKTDELGTLYTNTSGVVLERLKSFAGRYKSGTKTLYEIFQEEEKRKTRDNEQKKTVRETQRESKILQYERELTEKLRGNSGYKSSYQREQKKNDDFEF